jgi:hypothetical protein
MEGDMESGFSRPDDLLAASTAESEVAARYRTRADA